MTIAYLWTSVALVVAITDTSDKIDIKATLQKAWTHVGSYFVLIVMMSFILVGASLFFVIPAIILSLWFSTAVYVLIVENVKGSGALVKSKRYVQGYTLQVFVRIIVLGLLFLVGTIITSQFVRIFNNSVVEFAINTTLSLFSTPFSMIYSYHVYKNLREIKGDVSAVPSSRLKTLMVICGLVGVLIVPLIAGGVIYAAMNLPKTPAPIDYSSTYDQMLEDSIQE